MRRTPPNIRKISTTSQVEATSMMNAQQQPQQSSDYISPNHIAIATTNPSMNIAGNTTYHGPSRHQRRIMLTYTILCIVLFLSILFPTQAAHFVEEFIVPWITVWEGSISGASSFLEVKTEDGGNKGEARDAGLHHQQQMLSPPGPSASRRKQTMKKRKANEVSGSSTMICAHRGKNDFNRTQPVPEAMWELCTVHGICCADYDVYLTRDGVPFVGHPMQVFHALFKKITASPSAKEKKGEEVGSKEADSPSKIISTVEAAFDAMNKLTSNEIREMDPKSIITCPLQDIVSVVKKLRDEGYVSTVGGKGKKAGKKAIGNPYAPAQFTIEPKQEDVPPGWAASQLYASRVTLDAKDNTTPEEFATTNAREGGEKLEKQQQKLKKVQFPMLKNVISAIVNVTHFDPIFAIIIDKEYLKMEKKSLSTLSRYVPSSSPNVVENNNNNDGLDLFSSILGKDLSPTKVKYVFAIRDKFVRGILREALITKEGEEEQQKERKSSSSSSSDANMEREKENMKFLAEKDLTQLSQWLSSTEMKTRNFNMTILKHALDKCMAMCPSWQPPWAKMVMPSAKFLIICDAVVTQFTRSVSGKRVIGPREPCGRVIRGGFRREQHGAVGGEDEGGNSFEGRRYNTDLYFQRLPNVMWIIDHQSEIDLVASLKYRIYGTFDHVVSDHPVRLSLEIKKKMDELKRKNAKGRKGV